MFLVKKIKLIVLDGKIEAKRVEMINSGLGRGFTDEGTVRVSQELDVLLNKQFYLKKEYMESKRFIKQLVSKLSSPSSIRIHSALVSISAFTVMDKLV